MSVASVSFRKTNFCTGLGRQPGRFIVILSNDEFSHFSRNNTGHKSLLFSKTFLPSLSVMCYYDPSLSMSGQFSASCLAVIFPR